MHVAHHRASQSDTDSDVSSTRLRSPGSRLSGSAHGVLDPDSRRDTLEANVSLPSPSFSTVPTKRKRTSSVEEVFSPSSARTSARDTRCGYPKQEPRYGRQHRQDPSFHTPTSSSSTRTRSRRLVLDAVELVSKRSGRRMTDTKTSPTDSPSARKSASAYYPTPPVSRASRDAEAHGALLHANVPHSNTVTLDDHASLESTSPRKTSKYFTDSSAAQTRSMQGNHSVLTPPSSPMLTIPVYIESSDFEYPPLDDSFDDEPVQDTADASRRVPTWCDNAGLYDDLLIMLKRLKPILVQETVRGDPWKVLIAVRLLNVTTGKAAIPVFCKIISRWPTPQDLVCAPVDELVELLRPLGLYNKRAGWLRDMSMRFLEDQRAPNCSSPSLPSLLAFERTVPTEPHLRYPGVGPYALDSLRIFCADNKDAWKRVMPQDKELIRYLRWRWAVEEGKVWYPEGRGVIGGANVPYLITLVDDLAAHYDGTIGGEGYMYHFHNDLCGVLSGDMAGQRMR